MRKLALALIVLFTVSLLLNGCSTSSPSEPAASPTGKTGAVSTGSPVSAVSASISPEGGTIAVSDPGNPLAGLEIKVPSNSYSSATQFNVSYAPVEEHTFGEAFNPITPMIIVDNGGGYSEELIEVKIPVTVPEGHFAMGFLYDEETGQLEGLPLVTQDASSITVATRHFSNIIISSINQTSLERDIDSGFLPGVDDWQFVNYGSQIAKRGHCTGQAMTAMWYYIQRPDGPNTSLYGRYDNNGNEPATPDLWEDDSLGYRLSSVVQNDITYWTSDLSQRTQKVSKNDIATWRLFAYSMKMTSHPQLIVVHKTGESVAHAMIVYRIKNGDLYIADPNYPGDTERRVEFSNGKFQPYNSGANAREIAAGNGKAYNKIIYMGKSAFADWGKLAERWGELKNGTIGDDSFLSYKTIWLDDQGQAHELTDGLVSPGKMLNIGFQYQGGMPTKWRVYREGVRLTAGPRIFPGSASYELEPGNNRLGILLNAVIDGEEQYINFQYVNVVYNEPEGWILDETKKYPPGGSAESNTAGGGTIKMNVTETSLTWSHTEPSHPARTVAGMPIEASPGFTFTKTFEFTRPPDTLAPGEVVTITVTGELTISGRAEYPGGSGRGVITLTATEHDTSTQGSKKTLWQEGGSGEERRLWVSLGDPPVDQSFSFVAPAEGSSTKYVVLTMDANQGEIHWIYRFR